MYRNDCIFRTERTQNHLTASALNVTRKCVSCHNVEVSHDKSIKFHEF